MIREVQHQQIEFHSYLRALLIELLVLVNRYAGQNQESSFKHPSPVYEKVSEIVRYVNRNYKYPLSLPSISKQFYISPYYLSRIFKEVTGFTFIEYLNSVRIKEAQKLLSASKWKMTKIAEEVGFSSISHFGRVFKKITGLSPLHYRKLL